VKRVTCLGQHLVLFRTEKDEAKVLDAYCPHMGADLGVGGKVVGDCIECPFHKCVVRACSLPFLLSR
jgi:cholesterol 7-dehydrogenase